MASEAGGLWETQGHVRKVLAKKGEGGSLELILPCGRSTFGTEGKEAKNWIGQGKEVVREGKERGEATETKRVELKYETDKREERKVIRQR